MNNKNKILVGCLVLLLVLSVGYALFSETITINGTATAKGNFDIVGSCQAGIPSELVSGAEYFFEYASNQGGYKNDTCSITGNQGSFNVDFEYPGARRFFVFKFTNNGTIPATIGEAVAKNFKFCLNEYCAEGAPDEIYSDSGNSSSSIVIDLTYFVELLETQPIIVGVQIGDGEIIPYDKITQAQAAEFMDSNGNYILKPGNSVFYGIEANFSSKVGDEGYEGSYEVSNEVVYEFPFVQVAE